MRLLTLHMTTYLLAVLSLGRSGGFMFRVKDNLKKLGEKIFGIDTKEEQLSEKLFKAKIKEIAANMKMKINRKEESKKAIERNSNIFGADNDKLVPKYSPLLFQEHQMEQLAELFGPEEQFVEGDVWNKTFMKAARGQPSDNDNTSYIWISNVIPIAMDSLTPEKTNAVMAAIKDFHDHTCVRFDERTENDADYINIVSGKRTSSYIGRQGGKQDLSICDGCGYKGTIIHELMHNLGFFHEHTRPDRGRYVTVRKNNIRKGTESAFMQYNIPAWYPTRDGDDVYDPLSIMHVDSKFMSKDLVSETIIPIDKNVFIGQRSGFSKNDISRIKKAFCPDETPTTTATTTTTKAAAATTTTTTTTTRNKELSTTIPLGTSTQFKTLEPITTTSDINIITTKTIKLIPTAPVKSTVPTSKASTTANTTRTKGLSTTIPLTTSTEFKSLEQITATPDRNIITISKSITSRPTSKTINPITTTPVKSTVTKSKLITSGLTTAKTIKPMTTAAKSSSTKSAVYDLGPLKLPVTPEEPSITANSPMKSTTRHPVTTPRVIVKVTKPIILDSEEKPDNCHSSAYPCWPADFVWSSSGLPTDCNCNARDVVPSSNSPCRCNCLRVHGSNDDKPWSNNYLCYKDKDKNLHMRWSTKGDLPGKNCIQVTEPNETNGWDNNFLCMDEDVPYQFRWSDAGEVIDKGMKCLKLYEPEDKNGWDNNYLCAKSEA